MTPIRIDRSRIGALSKLTVLGCVLALIAACTAEPSSEWRFTDVDRIVAVSDIHGAYEPMVATFQEAGVIDENLGWIGAATHLVVAGDILDRGPQSRRVLDLMIRLEEEAQKAGGQVHILLGNHEVMNLIGDTRYISDEEFAAFSTEESVEEREHWFQQFREHALSYSDEETIRRKFNRLAPPGFFGHRRAFRFDGHYGKWLLDKPFVIVINDTAYVHGGLPTYVAEHGLKGVNASLKNDLLEFLKARSMLEDLDWLNPIDKFRDLPPIIQASLAISKVEQGASKSAELVVKLSQSPLHRSNGPLWYRGNATCSGLTEGDTLNAALKSLGASRVVIGHTTTPTRRIQTRFGGRVIEVNTGMLQSSYGGHGYALIIQDDQIEIASELGETGLLPVAPPRRVGKRPAKLDDAALDELLMHGEVSGFQTDQNARQLLRLSVAEQDIWVYFDASQERQNFPELAAYKLDRMLGLDMVPVTVRRDLGGRTGSLQLATVDALTEIERLSDSSNSGPCPIPAQHASMQIFDLLIGNEHRSPHTMLYENDDWQLILVDHKHAFGDLALEDLQQVSVGEEWKTVLRQLSADELQSSLGNELDKPRLEALTHRVEVLSKP